MGGPAADRPRAQTLRRHFYARRGRGLVRTGIPGRFMWEALVFAVDLIDDQFLPLFLTGFEHPFQSFSLRSGHNVIGRVTGRKKDR